MGEAKEREEDEALQERAYVTEILDEILAREKLVGELLSRYPEATVGDVRSPASRARELVALSFQVEARDAAAEAAEAISALVEQMGTVVAVAQAEAAASRTGKRPFSLVTQPRKPQ